MQINQESSNSFVQRFSIWKTVGMEVVLVAGAVLPLIPGFSTGLRYTAFLYRMPFFLALVAACAIFGLLALSLVPILALALRRTPVFVLSGDLIRVSGIRERSARVKDVKKITPLWPGGNLNVEVQEGKSMALPVFLYENTSATKNKLNEIIKA